MKTRIASSIALPLAGALALLVTGCGSMHSDRSDSMAQSSGYVGQPYNSPSTPAKMDPFSRAYIPFPASATDTPPVSGHSEFCQMHTNQPGCQTYDSVRFSRNDTSSRTYYRDGWRGPVVPSSAQ